MELLKNIENLSKISGVSGDESRVADYITQQIKEDASWHIDNLGNIIAFKKGEKTPKNKIMISAHMDEVGLIITYIEESGLLRFGTVGSIDRRVVVGKTVQVGASGIFGVIGTKAIHQQSSDEKDKPIDFDKLFIDIGAQSREEAQEFINLGDGAVFNSEFLHFGDNLIKGRALDDRAGCAMLIELIHTPLKYDAYFTFTVQEEIGCIGGTTAANTIHPDMGIIVESTTACDIAGVEPDHQVCVLSKGAVVSFMDRGTIYHKELFHLALDIAKRKEIPLQVKAGVYGGNESRSVQVSGEGAKVLAISLPCRYIHTPNSVLHKDDIYNGVKIIKELLEEMAIL